MEVDWQIFGNRQPKRIMLETVDVEGASRSQETAQAGNHGLVRTFRDSSSQRTVTTASFKYLEAATPRPLLLHTLVSISMLQCSEIWICEYGSLNYSIRHPHLHLSQTVNGPEAVTLTHWWSNLQCVTCQPRR